MDRRQQKTRRAIFTAFGKLLETKRYEQITVQDIIDEADVGRSTFYVHFETKDDLLKSMCTDIFDHVFTKTLPEGEILDDTISLEMMLAHVLFHLREKKENIKGLLRSESSELFMRYFKEYLTLLFSKYTDTFRKDIPKDFLLNQLVGSFAEAVKWWINEDTKHSNEEVAEFFIKMTRF